MEIFRNFSEYKVIMSNAYSSTGTSFALHNNFLITGKTTVLDFYKHYQPNLHYLSTNTYNLNNIEFVHIKCFSVDDMKNKTLKLTLEDRNKIVYKTIESRSASINQETLNFHSVCINCRSCFNINLNSAYKKCLLLKYNEYI